MNNTEHNDNTPSMQWIEKYRLEISIQLTAKDAKKQLQKLHGKNKKALQAEFKEWLSPDDKLEIEQTEFMDYNGNW